MSNIWDVAIIGSGPAGWTAAIYAARSGAKTVVVASDFEAGGALMNTTLVENYPGFSEGIMGPDLMEQMELQASNCGATIMPANATELSLDADIKRVFLEGEEEPLLARAVILAMGAAHRHLEVPGEAEYSAKGVSYCATCDGPMTRNHRVAVVGGGDSACEEALFLARFADEVFMIHRRGELRASRAMQDKVFATENITMMWNTVVQEVLGDGQEVNALRLKNLLENTVETVPMDDVFVAVGLLPRSELVREQVSVSEEGHVEVLPEVDRTKCAHQGRVLPGVFAAGDLVDHRYRQAITAAASGCQAALDAQRYLEGLPKT